MAHAMVAIRDASTMPMSYHKAINSLDTANWLTAIKAEHDTIKKTKTYLLVKLPAGHWALRSKTIFKLKLKASRATDWHKAHVMVQGCGQREGINYFETYTPVLCYKSPWFLNALTVKLDLEIHQMDVNSAFLQADREDKIYMCQPEGFVDAQHPTKVWRLLKSLYG